MSPYNIKTNLLNKATILKLASFFALLVLMSLFQAILAPKAHATTYNVSEFSNVTGCGFVEAMAAINATPIPSATCAAASAPNTVNLAAGTYTIPPGAPSVQILTDGDLSIAGAGPGNTIIDGNSNSGLFYLNAPGHSSNYSFGGFTLKNFLLATNFDPPYYSGIIIESGNLNLNNIVAHDNNCLNGGSCAIFNNNSNTISDVVISNSSFFNNQASTFAYGNQGCQEGAQEAGYINLNIYNNTFVNNIFYDTGVGQVNLCGPEKSTIKLTNNTIANNKVRRDSQVNTGIFLVGSWGEFTPDPDYFMQNNVFYNNYTNSDSPPVVYYNSVGAQANSDLPSNCVPPTSYYYSNGYINPTSLGGNISSDDTCSSVFTASNDKNNTDPMLDALTSQYPFVMPITQSSPAFDNGIANGAPATDQRGVTRPQYSAFDSGAYELAVSTPELPNTGNLASTGFDMKIPALIASIMALTGIAVAGYSLKRR